MTQQSTLSSQVIVRLYFLFFLKRVEGSTWKEAALQVETSVVGKNI